MKTILLLLISIVVIGCSSNEKVEKSKNVENFMKSCNGILTTELSYSKYNDTITVKCEEDKRK